MPPLWANALVTTYGAWARSEEHTSELQSRLHLVCRLLLEKKKHFIPRFVIRAESRCTSCGAVLSGKGTTLFPCPSCGKTRIGRCSRCRYQFMSYRCPPWSF